MASSRLGRITQTRKKLYPTGAARNLDKEWRRCQPPLCTALNNDPEEFQALRVVRVADGVDVVKSRRSQVAFREQSDDPAFDVSGRATRLAINLDFVPYFRNGKAFPKGFEGRTYCVLLIKRTQQGRLFQTCITAAGERTHRDFARVRACRFDRWNGRGHEGLLRLSGSLDRLLGGGTQGHRRNVD